MSLKKRHLSYLFTIALLFTLGGTVDLLSENIFLKDGRIINGSITGDAAKSITVRKADGKSEVISRDNILRILYTELAMGKIHVQMRDGSNFEAFIVDEDQKSFTFRKVLLSPDELKVDRSDILFISERNPSGLKGTPDTGSIELSWFPPYNPVKHYLVYHREKSEGDFRPALKSRGKSLTLENLKSNTDYVIKVTAVDNSNEESSPSNVLTVSTKNILPGRPRILSATETRSEDGRRALMVRWDAALDPDGKVEKYRIYSVWKEKKNLLKESQEDQCLVEADAKQGRLYLSAVDNIGDESAMVKLDGKDMSVALYPGAVLPLGSFGAITGPGFGGVAAFTMSGYFHSNLVLGAETGYYSFQGKDALDSEYKKTTTAYMIPLILTAGYSFGLTMDFYIMPYLNMGAAYFYADYVNRDRVTLNDSKENISEFGPAAGAGVAALYNVTPSIGVALRLSFGYLIGADSGLYCGLDIGSVYRIW